MFILGSYGLVICFYDCNWKGCGRWFIGNVEVVNIGVDDLIFNDIGNYFRGVDWYWIKIIESYFFV